MAYKTAGYTLPGLGTCTRWARGIETSNLDAMCTDCCWRGNIWALVSLISIYSCRPFGLRAKRRALCGPSKTLADRILVLEFPSTMIEAIFGPMKSSAPAAHDGFEDGAHTYSVQEFCLLNVRMISCRNMRKRALSRTDCKLSDHIRLDPGLRCFPRIGSAHRRSSTAPVSSSNRVSYNQ